MDYRQFAYDSVEGAVYMEFQTSSCTVWRQTSSSFFPVFHTVQIAKTHPVVDYGASGITSDEERKQVYALAERMPNIVGFQMDDFFIGNDKAALSLDELRSARKELIISGRKLDLCVTLYTHQLFPTFKEHLALCDIVSFWTWKAEDLKNLESNFC